MKIILDESEMSELRGVAKDYDISIEGLFDTYTSVMEANFDQDIRDCIAEDEDQIRQDYGGYEEEA